jgi:hypothetical protein
MAGYGTPGNIANLTPFKPGNTAARRSPWPEKALRAARRACPEAIATAIECMRDTEAPWPERMAGVKVILAEGLPRKRDAFEAIFAAAGDGFIEVRFVAPGERSEHEPRPNGHDMIRISYDADGE